MLTGSVGSPLTGASSARKGGVAIPNVLLRIDAGGEIGLGHVVRTSAMLNMVEQPFNLTIVGTGDALESWFPGTRICMPGDDDVADTARLAESLAIDLFICDHPRAPEDIWDRVRYRRDLPCVAIDDKGGRVAADLIINGTVIEELHNYVRLAPGARVLTGPEYTLVRTDFGRSPWQPDSDGNRVVIVIGSGQRASDWGHFLTSGEVEIEKWGDVTLAAGGDFASSREFHRRCAARAIHLRQGVNAAELAAILSRVTVALTTGGMIVYECVVAGVPAVVFPQESDLVGECAWFARKGCVMDVGYEGGFSASEINKSVSGLLGNRQMRLEMSSAARGAMDGRGMERAAGAINSLLQRSIRYRHST